MTALKKKAKEMKVPKYSTYKVNTDLINEILKINGISNVLNISLINKYDGLYSPVRYKIEQAYSKQGIYYPSQIPSIFQLKYPEFDIVGNVL